MEIYADEIEVDPDELHSLSIRQLREICDAVEIEHKSLTKAELILVISDTLSEEGVEVPEEDDIDMELRKEAARQGKEY